MSFFQTPPLFLISRNAAPDCFKQVHDGFASGAELHAREWRGAQRRQT
jgi:hypothetical protein